MLRRRPALKPRVRSNEQIRVPEIRLIGAAGEQIGVVATEVGLEKAREAGLDLVEVTAQSKPPVCKILDLGKYLYSLDKKEKESRKKQKTVDVKEIKMTSKIEAHDYQTKLRNARRFLERGDKVKLRVFFRGREITHAERGKDLVKRFCGDLDDISEIERDEGLQGNAIHVYFMPARGKKKVAKEKEAGEEKKEAAPKAE